LTIPVTIPSGKRFFSRLKLIKTLSSIDNVAIELVGFSLLSIKNNIAQSLDFAAVLLQFASLKVHKVAFSQPQGKTDNDN